MINQKVIIQSVPTNIITGFLGVGKTSAILQLLKNKPESERWAVLVNEFGEIGVDGSLLSGQQAQDDSVFIREVPGGCMCCAAGLPMQIALNQLLKIAKPDRLLIEPTGLGHPMEILQILSTGHYSETLSVQKTLTLVDARNLLDTRYTSHDTFNQQIAIADMLVGNKADMYQEEDKSRLISYAQKRGRTGVPVIFSEQGNIDISCLFGNTSVNALKPNSHEHHIENKPLLSDLPLPECGYIKALNQGEGFKSLGWRFSSKTIFNYSQLLAFLTSLKVERVKAVFMTDKGAFAYNAAKYDVSEVVIDECNESRFEIISEQLESLIEAKLFACINT